MDAPDAAVRFARSPWSRVLQFVGDPGRVLDEFAVEVHDIKTAVGSGRREHAVKPGIRRSQEIFARLCALGDEGRSIRQEAPALNQIVDRLTDKEVAVVVRAERVAAI